jgi:pimeloyl-ACP methyl ester carboxylesterase
MYQGDEDRPEQLVDVGRGVTLCCERLGDPAAPPMLLIMGLGQQLIAWPEELCRQLLDAGFQLIRFDNRDIGRSTHWRLRPPRMSQLIARRFDPEQYDLADMALDTANLLDALELSPAHVVGVSMGGMIAQTLAARHPGHVRSLASIMSSTGSRRAGWVAPSTLRMVLSAPARDRDAAAERAARLFSHIGSQGFPFDERSVRERAARAFDRDSHAPAGTGRQMAAVLKSGDRTRELRAITAPTLVIHGDHDRMVHASGGRATAQAIPGAQLHTIEGMGHDLPAGALAQIADLLSAHAAAADHLQSTAAPA